jgi:ParB family transcriptional regulator, chromosome partitioning protein
MKDEIKLISINQIHILNPRFRDRKKFELIVQSIKNLGLKKPIQVSVRGVQETGGPGYDLVCGQGRIEAFKALGYTEIPAIVVEVSKEERLLRSLIENMARRFPAPAELLQEINRLKAKGYKNSEVARKLDLSDSTISGFLTLKKAGEERLLHAVLLGRIPVSVAMDIARTDGMEDQRALLKAYEKKQLNGDAIRAVKRLLAHRRFLGKQRTKPEPGKKKALTSAESLVQAYRREGERLKLMIRKAKVCNTKLTFVVTAFSELLHDENFTNLLRAESMVTMPKNLWTKVAANQKEAA